MRKIIYILMLSGLVMTGCEEFTELQPKGKNLLTKVSDLDALLNNDYQSCNTRENTSYLINDMYPSFTNLPNLVNNPKATLNQILLNWDETLDRTILTQSDTRYSSLYGVIGQIANPVISKADAAEGNQTMAQQLKAEALVLRGWLHYVLVNHYAKAYNPTSAATDPGIPYMLDDVDITIPSEKATVQQVYDNALADVNAAIELNSLPAKPINKMRVGKAFAYAAKAVISMAMRDFSGAEEAAKQSLAINNYIDDQRRFIAPGQDSIYVRLILECNEDLWFTWGWPYGIGFSPEMIARFEQGSIMYNYGQKIDGQMYFGLPIDIWFGEIHVSMYGLTTVDMYLLIAECNLRAGKIDEAMHQLDLVRVNRIDPKYYQPLEGTVTDAATAFQKIKQLSMTENVFSCKNYINLKRWNTEDAYKETITKDFLGKHYELTPESPLWIYPFPQNATAHNEHLTQNY